MRSARRRGILNSVSSFSPLDLNPALWLDAADATTITESGGFVSQWNDKSGNGRNATQSIGANQPTTGSFTINGLNALSFDGINDQLRFATNVMSGATAGTCFAVYTINSVVDMGALLVFGDDYAFFSNGPRTTFGTTSRRGFAPGATLTNPTLYSYVAATNDWRAYVNKINRLSLTLNTVSFPNNIPGSTQGFYLARSAAAGIFYAGLAAEIVLYDYALSDASRQRLQLGPAAKAATVSSS
jgi:hypothetical protein